MESIHGYQLSAQAPSVFDQEKSSNKCDLNMGIFWDVFVIQQD